VNQSKHAGLKVKGEAI